MTFDCQKCGAEIEVDNTGMLPRCSCGQAYRLNIDAEFVDGQWRNLSSIHPVICDCFMRSQYHEPMCPNEGMATR